MSEIEAIRKTVIATSNEYEDVPTKVRVAPRLASDISVLKELTRVDKSPRRLVRASKSSSTIYTGGCFRPRIWFPTTDNMVAEYAFYKRKFSSSLLFEFSTSFGYHGLE